MNTLSDIGQLLYLYLEEIIPDESFECPSFVVEAGAQLLQNNSQRNWVPLIVKQTAPKQYQAIQLISLCNRRIGWTGTCLVYFGRRSGNK